MRRATGVRASLLTAFLLVIAFAARSAQDAAPPPEAEVQTAEVRFDDRTLFRVRGMSSYPAGERAAAIAARIATAARDPSLSPEAIVISPRDPALEIRAGDTMLLTLVPADAALESVRLEVLAEAHRQRIRHA